MNLMQNIFRGIFLVERIHLRYNLRGWRFLCSYGLISKCCVSITSYPYLPSAIGITLESSIPSKAVLRFKFLTDLLKSKNPWSGVFYPNA